MFNTTQIEKLLTKIELFEKNYQILLEDGEKIESLDMMRKFYLELSNEKNVIETEENLSKINFSSYSASLLMILINTL